MILSFGDRWLIRREYFGALAVDKTGEDRVLYLNRPAATIVELCIRAPRQLDDLVTWFGNDSRTTIQSLVHRQLLEADLVDTYRIIESSEIHDVVSTFDMLNPDYLTAPFEVNLYTTTRCNLNCKFCYLSADTRQQYGPNVMERTLLAKALSDCAEAGVMCVNFLGGEPFLDQQAIRYAIEHYYNRFLISITTNGTIAPDDYTLSLLSRPGVDVIVSIHSSKPEVHDFVTQATGAWHRAVHTLKRLTRAGVRTAVQMVLTRFTTKDDVIGLVRMARELGANGFYVNNMFPGSHMSLEEYVAIAMPPEDVRPIAEELNELRRHYSDSFYIFPKGTYLFAYNDEPIPNESGLDKYLWPVVDGLTSLEVMSDGQVFPGPVLLNGISEPVGNLREKTLYDVWHSTEMQQRRKRPTISYSPCRECVHVSVCGGGSGSISRVIAGRETAGDVRCPRVWRLLVQAN
ncbi:radical SAM protein [Thermaerobacter subterraneus]|uniref:Fe-S oxidoreductase n=1 Tax=Thermaerobacter subterraneus DSM 13965 TaxID=867903 RepID=K6QF63_9FIRM|nr:radical SAM protein [Thermaerobacter subterraneus]EKP95591.1 putative Fe-S oxidoreductase [Thermaerobacter subterraneus DSM 13965]